MFTHGIKNIKKGNVPKTEKARQYWPLGCNKAEQIVKKDADGNHYYLECPAQKYVIQMFFIPRS